MQMRYKLVFIAAALACGQAGAQVAAGPDVAAPDVATQWDAFLAKGSLEEVDAAVDALDGVGYALSSVDADKCKSGGAKLALAQKQVPVSIAIQRAALLCADAIGDEAAAERATSAIAALASHAFHQSDRGAWPRPVRIVLLSDAYALLATAGLEFKYEFYPQLHATPYYPIYIAAANPETGVERHVQFDFIDSLQALDRKDPAYGTPRLRMAYVDSVVDSAAKRGEIAALDVQAVAAAITKGKPEERIAAVKQATLDGGLNSAATWLAVCVGTPSEGCGNGLVDALLPQVEAKHAYPMMMLATAYLEGVGVSRDQKAAEATLEAADRLWEHHGASVAFAQMQLLMHPKQPLAPYLRARLDAAKKAGNVAAQAVALGFDIVRGKDNYSLTAADEALLANPDNNGLGQGLLLLAGWYESQDQVKSDAYLQRAAEANSAGALRLLAVKLREAQGSRPLTQETRSLLERAANGGDTTAMRYLAYYSYAEGNPRRAEDWLIPAAARSDVDALFFLASLWLGGYEDMSGDAERAVAMYKSLAGDTGYAYAARARRDLAGLAIQGRGMPKDLKQARTWLTEDAEAGDADSQSMLGGLLLSGQLGPADIAAGGAWLERAIDAGSVDAMSSYGLWLHDSGTSEADHARGVALSRKAADEGNVLATNNVAWMLCVSPHPEVRNATDGMAYARKMEAIPDLDPGALDTVAACYAAAGDFKRAAELQQEVLDTVDKLPGDAGKASRKEMAARLALFQSGKPYVQPLAKKP